MFPLAHIGITLGLAVGLTHYLKKNWDPKLFFLAVGGGSMLPDLIDKPIGSLLGYPGGGRLVAHTLMFAVLSTLVAFPVYRILKSKDERWNRLAPYVPFAVSGMWFHLVLDEMWYWPTVLFWPTLGLDFPSGEFNWLGVLSSPLVLIGEIVSGAILVVFGIRYIRVREDRKPERC